MRTPKPASIRCSLVTSAQPRRQLRSCWVAQERDLLAVFQFNGQPYFDLAGELGVFALVGCLDSVPEGVALEYPGGGIGRGQDFAVLDAALVGVVVGDAGGVFVEL